jgi:repressor LexA
MQPELTTKQNRVLRHMQRAISRRGRVPSLRQMAADLGVSHAAVAQIIRALEDKGCLKRDGRYSRNIYLLNRTHQTAAPHRWREIPIIGQVTAGLPMYAQQEWDGTLVIDADIFPVQNVFALHVRGNSMLKAGILDGDMVICEPRQYAHDGEIVVALVHDDEATVKRFFLHEDHIELRPENPRFKTQRYNFDEVMVQGKVIGVQRGPEGIR